MVNLIDCERQPMADYQRKCMSVVNALISMLILSALVLSSVGLFAEESVDKDTNPIKRFELSINGSIELWSNRTNFGHELGAITNNPEIKVNYVGTCPMHQAERPEVIVERLAQLKKEQRVPTCLLMDLCVFKLEEGLSLFHASVDIIRVDPFSAQNAAGSNQLLGPSRLLSRLNHAMGPGRSIAAVPIDGRSANLVWSRTLLALAHGCRGVHFMTSATQRERQRLQLIVEDQVHALKDSLSLWDGSVPLGEVETGSLEIGAWLVRLQPTRLALVVVRGDAPDDFTGKVQFSCALPDGVRVSRAVDLAGADVLRFATPKTEFAVDIPDVKNGLIWYLDVLPSTVPAHEP